jgi:hypothetical protein
MRQIPIQMKIAIIVLLLLVLVSLFSGLFFMYRDKGQTKRTVHALTLRIAISLVTFAFIMLGFYMGWLPGK